MKALLIARVSTEEQRDAGNSLPAQIARLERYCQRNGYEILELCSFDESAYCTQRSEFDRIIDIILNQKEKVIVCCDKVDRLSRNVFDKRISILYEKALNDDIELHFVSDGQVINSSISAVEKFQFSISLGLAKYYSDAISDNVRRAFEQKIRKGEWLAMAPFGYKNIKKPGGETDIIVDEYEAHVIQKIFQLYATAAFSMNLLCEKIEKEFGLKWPKGYLGKVLNNPFYHGTMIIKGKEYPHRYPPIISTDLFNQVQQVKDAFIKKPFMYMGKPYIYRGLIRCGDCGYAITPEKHKGLVYYHCTQFLGKHGAKWFREEEITKQLSNAFLRLQLPDKILEEILYDLNESQNEEREFVNKEYDKALQEQKTANKMLDNLYLDKLKGRITESEYDKFYQSLSQDAADLSLRLERLQEADQNYYLTVRHVLELSSKAYDIFISSEVEERRQLIKLILSNLRIEGENLLWEAQKPFNMIMECNDGLLWRG